MENMVRFINESAAEAGQQDNDIRPIASARDMHTQQRLGWKNSAKKRTIERGRERA